MNYREIWQELGLPADAAQSITQMGLITDVYDADLPPAQAVETGELATVTTPTPSGTGIVTGYRLGGDQ